MGVLQTTIFAALVIGALSQSPLDWNMQQQFPLPTLGVNPGVQRSLTGAFGPVNPGVSVPVTGAFGPVNPGVNVPVTGAFGPVNPGVNVPVTGAFGPVNPGVNVPVTGAFGPVNQGVNVPGFADRFGQGFLEDGVRGTNVLLSPPGLPMGFQSNVPSGPQFLPNDPFNTVGFGTDFREPAVRVPWMPNRQLQPFMSPNFSPLGPTAPLGSRAMGVPFPGTTLSGPVSKLPVNKGAFGGHVSSAGVLKPKLPLFPQKSVKRQGKPMQMGKLPVLPVKY